MGCEACGRADSAISSEFAERVYGEDIDTLAKRFAREESREDDPALDFKQRRNLNRLARQGGEIRFFCHNCGAANDGVTDGQGDLGLGGAS